MVRKTVDSIWPMRIFVESGVQSVEVPIMKRVEVDR
jgi:hypothetical protein